MDSTRDTFWGGELILWQPARGQGYRFTIDAVLLAGFAQPAEHVLDVGAGCGIVGLMLLCRNRAERVTAVEIQPEMATLIKKNAEENGVAHRLEVIVGDVREVSLPTVDAVVCNPPYFQNKAGHGALEKGRDLARHERSGTLTELVSAAARSLKQGGMWQGIVPQARTGELHAALRQQGLGSIVERAVISKLGKAPGHALVAAQHGDPSLQEGPHVVVHETQGYSAEVQRWLDK